MSRRKSDRAASLWQVAPDPSDVNRPAPSFRPVARPRRRMLACRMRKLFLALGTLLVLAGAAAGLFLMREAPAPPATAIVSVPVVPAPAPAPAPVVAAPKRSDLPTVAVDAHPVHAVPEGEPPPAKPVTLRTRDGRTIDPASGRLR